MRDSFYVVDSRIQIHDLRPATFVLADSTNQLTLQDIASAKFSDKFKPVSAFNNFKSYTSYWLRLPIATQGSIKNWWLMLRQADKNYYSTNTYEVNYNFVDVYFCNERYQLLSKQLTGLFMPRSQKQIKNTAGINRVLFSGGQGQKQIVYIRIYNEFGFGSAPAYVEIHNPAVPLPAGNRDWLITMMGGIIFFFSLFSFSLFLFVKDKSYLFFGIYTLLTSQIYLTKHSRLPFIDWYIPEHPQWFIGFEAILESGIYIFFLMFGRSFINLPSLSKRTDNFLRVFIAVWIFYTLAQLIVVATSRHYIIPLPYSTLIFTLLAILFVIRFAFFKNIFARLFVIGGLWLLFFTL